MNKDYVREDDDLDEYVRATQAQIDRSNRRGRWVGFASGLGFLALLVWWLTTWGPA